MPHKLIPSIFYFIIFLCWLFMIANMFKKEIKQLFKQQNEEVFKFYEGDVISFNNFLYETLENGIIIKTNNDNFFMVKICHSKFDDSINKEKQLLYREIKSIKLISRGCKGMLEDSKKVKINKNFWGRLVYLFTNKF